MLNFNSKKMMLINEKGKPLILEVNGVSTSLGYGIAKLYLPIVFNPTATAPYVVPVPSKISFDINVPSTGTLYRQPGLDSSGSNQTSLGTLQSGDNHVTVDFSTNPTTFGGFCGILVNSCKKGKSSLIVLKFEF